MTRNFDGKHENIVNISTDLHVRVNFFFRSFSDSYDEESFQSPILQSEIVDFDPDGELLIFRCLLKQGYT